jgi:molybdopterin converting factor small subunit
VSARLRLFARAREVAGTSVVDLPADRDLADFLDDARERFGAVFGDVLDTSRVWINGDEPHDGLSSLVRDGDEVAVLPPVSGGT